MAIWLPTLPLEEIDAAALESFVRAGHGENVMLEYKVVAEAAKIPEDVAAFANTYGGLVIVGVPDHHDGDLALLEDVPVEEESRLTSRLIDRLDPPWVPDMAFVTVNGTRLLLLKIEAASAPRPVLCSSKALARYGNQNGPMGRESLAAMFNAPRRVAAAPQLLMQVPGSRRSLLADASGPELLVRVAVGAPAFPEQVMTNVIGSGFRQAVRWQLDASSLRQWLSLLAVESDLDHLTATDDAPPARIGQAGFDLVARSGSRGDAGARLAAHVLVDATQTPQSAGLEVVIDVGLWPRKMAEDRSLADHGAVKSQQLKVRRLRLHEIGRLMKALTVTASEVLGVVSEGLLDGGLPAPALGPAGWLHTARRLEDLIDVDPRGATVIEDVTLGAEHYFEPPDRLPEDEAAVDDTVEHWLRTLSHRAGLVPPDHERLAW